MLKVRNNRKFLSIAIGAFLLSAIGLLTLNVSKEIKVLGTANSDNVQWSLAQAEVEFLGFSSQLNRSDPDLSKVRRKFDVFYSRIQTLSTATVFADSRSNPVFQKQLSEIQSFLNENVVLIDSQDAQLKNQLNSLKKSAEKVAPSVRQLSISGLEQFATTADQQRKAVARTMTLLAVALITLIGALAFLVYYLAHLYQRTTKRELEQKLTATRMNTVMSTSLDGVIVSNSEGKIIEFSPAAEAIFGHAAKDVLGKEIGDVIVPDQLRDAHNAGMERMRKHGEKRVVGKGRVTLEAKRADGSLFPVELAIQSATTDEGEVFIAFLRDISKRVADQEELIATRDRALAGEKMKTDFLATMSHEIRTPLNGLLGNMDLLKETKLSTIQEGYVHNMKTSGRLLMSHISDVLDITRYDAGKLNVRTKPLDISALMQDIIDSQASMASANETSLEWGWDGPAIGWINSDRDRLQHVLMNLIGNAVKFTKNGKVILTAKAQKSKEQTEIIFEVSDTGPGISKELSTRIFDDFVTGNTNYDREVGGTGLGLSIAKRFVSALNGEIWLESEEGKGSKFFVKLPVTLSDMPNEIQNRSKAKKTIRQFNVLLVEDNEINRVVAREMLESDGHKVSEAFDGEQGFEMAQSEFFDIILMDISMPIMDGRTSTRKIRSSNGASSATRIIALTANAMEEEQENFLSDGMNGILTKPLTKNSLREVLEDIESELRETPVTYVDQDHVLETKNSLGAEAYKKLFQRFNEEVNDFIKWLKAAGPETNQEIADRSHKIAGSAAVFGCVEFRNHLLKLENNAKANSDFDRNQQAQKLLEIWQASKNIMP